jgi:hypothetical protein
MSNACRSNLFNEMLDMATFYLSVTVSQVPYRNRSGHPKGGETHKPAYTSHGIKRKIIPTQDSYECRVFVFDLA